MLRDLHVGQNPPPDWDSFLWARQATGLQNWVEARDGPLLPVLGLSSSKGLLVLYFCFVSWVSRSRWLGFGNAHGWLTPSERVAFSVV